MAGEQWYLTIRTPEPSLDVWPIVVDDAPVELRDARILAAKTLKSVPSDWFEYGQTWQVNYGPGLPHPTILAAATLHDSPPTT